MSRFATLKTTAAPVNNVAQGDQHHIIHFGLQHAFMLSNFTGLDWTGLVGEHVDSIGSDLTMPCDSGHVWHKSYLQSTDLEYQLEYLSYQPCHRNERLANSRIATHQSKSCEHLNLLASCAVYFAAVPIYRQHQRCEPVSVRRCMWTLICDRPSI